MTTPSGGNPDDETWRRPEQPDGAPAVDRPDDSRPAATSQPQEDAPTPETTIGADAPPADGNHREHHDPDGAAGQQVPDPGTPDGAGATSEAASPWSREGAMESPWARPDAATPAGGWTATAGQWPGPPGNPGPPWTPGPGGPPGHPGPPAHHAPPGHASAYTGPPGHAGPTAHHAPPGHASAYTGPPPSTPPPPGWRPPVHVRVPPPRQLPAQDMVAMDRSEQRAQQLTYGIGAVVGVVLVLLTCLLCSRLLF
ncbi:hypothetical protein O7602_25165 [Micromonospora sp. WMMD1128]|uniref:hypothetical protein n=1 Tax=unclassified Micromonospora TaxID=2617518 RepID=UPI00248D18C2|nr:MULTISPECIES: hypothetical protein [unclassified Micromonospora]WBB72949.1 hypothetical protein O7602_25165 [Micromonospora sp. WMMD1128]WFE33603.1 hypothetical protein O7613_29495 [Micromonospora sp. WMMD975]